MIASTTLIRDFARFCRAYNLFSPKAKLLVAVSGGVDSMVLLDLLCNLKSEWQLEVAIVHLNHQLRGEESLADEEFVRRTAVHAQIPFFCKRVDTLELKHTLGVSKQVAAREARYQYFEATRRESNSDYVATGHQADDNAETVLFNALRGTGIRGLAGIPITRDPGRIIRPLLFARRRAILTYADENSILFRNDSSNESVVYSRNYLRHSVVPLLSEEVGTDIVDTLNRISHATTRLGHLVDRLLDAHLPLMVEFNANGCSVSLPLFSREPLFLKEEIILHLFRHFNVEPKSAKINEVIELCTKQTGHYLCLNAHVLAYKVRNRLVFSKGIESKDFAIDVLPGKTYSLDQFTFSLGEPGPVPAAYVKDGTTEYIDGDKIREPLTLRKWRAGDWFVPLGMKGRKKLSDFFTDAKVSPLEKINAPVLAAGGDIIWVCGRRIDDRYRITSATRNAVKLSFSPTASPVN